MKLSAVAVAALLATSGAHAESFFAIEAGLGAARVVDMGDGTWQQWGAPMNLVKLQSPVVTLGVTGEVWRHRAIDVRYHADYVYVGEYSAQCECAEHDEDYNTSTHTVAPGAPLGFYSGHGHLNGFALTLDAGYTYRGYRMSIEGGAWAYLQTWNQYARTSWGTYELQTPKDLHISYVVGARVARGNAAIAYRYYHVKQDWSNGVPGLATGVHALTFNYRF